MARVGRNSYGYAFPALIIAALLLFALFLAFGGASVHASSQVASAVRGQATLAPSSGSASATPIVVSFGTSYPVYSSASAQVPYSPTAYSPVSSVAQYNQNNAQLFLDCSPLNPSGTTSNVLFYSGYAPYVAGAYCLNNIPSLQTTLTLGTEISWTGTSPATAVVQQMEAGSAANVVVYNLAYSPMVDNTLSNGFSTNTYIFQPIPSYAQNDIWTWSAVFANFGNANGKLPQSETWDNNGQSLSLQSGSCVYSYTYSETTSLDSVNNYNIPFDIVTGPEGSASSTQSFTTPALPYLTYNFNAIIPNSGSQINPGLNGLQYDIFSPWNYYNSNSLNPITIDLPTGFFAGYNGKLDQCEGPVSYGSIFCLANGAPSPLNLGNANQQSPLVATVGGCPDQIYQPEPAGTPQQLQLTVAQAEACIQQASSNIQTDFGLSGGQQLSQVQSEILLAIAKASSNLYPSSYQPAGSNPPQVNQGQCSVGALDNFGSSPPSNYCTDTSTGCSSSSISQPSTCAGYYRGLLGIGSWGTGSSIVDYTAYNPVSVFENVGYDMEINPSILDSICAYNPQSCVPSSSSNIGAYCQYMPSGYTGPYCPAGVAGTANSCPDQIYQIGDLSSQLTVQQATACASEAGFSGISLEVAVAITEAESGLHPGEYAPNGNPPPPDGQDVYDSSGNWDRGIAQINSQYHNDVPDSCTYNPTCAYQQLYTISNEGTDFLPWCTYDPNCNPASTSVGDYCQYMPITYSGPYCPQGGGHSVSGEPVSGPPSAPPTPVITTPLSVAALPDDYVFVLSGGGSEGYILNALRLNSYGNAVSPGDPTTAISQAGIDCNVPSAQQGGNPCASQENQWNSEWNMYWNSIANYQNSFIYDAAPPVYFNQVLPGFTPYNISADYNGNVFVIGQTDGNPELVRVNNILGSGVHITSNAISTTGSSAEVPSSIASTLQEIAVSPTGQQVYLASPESGSIYVFDGNSLSLEDTINLAYTSGPGAQLPSSAQGGAALQGLQATLSIPAYLENNGLYGVSMPWVESTVANQNDVFDQESFHHPLGIQDINGYLYVLDNWHGVVGANPGIRIASNGGLFFNMLMLRVFNSSGSNLPMSPSFVSDLYQQETCQASSSINNYQCISATAGQPPASVCQPSDECQPQLGLCSTGGLVSYSCVGDNTGSKAYYSLAAPGFFTSNTYPPYGWVLSANVMPWQHGIFASEAPSVSFCAEGCTYGPQYTSFGGYSPIGPSILAENCPIFNLFCYSPQVGGVGFSVNYNYTADFIFPKSGQANTYGELLFADTGVENYTKLFNGTTYYSCYVDQNLGVLPSGFSGPQLAPPCHYSSEIAKTVDSLSPPIYTAYDPFAYMESAGSSEFFNYQDLFGSAFTGASGAPQSVASSTYNTLCIQELQNGNVPSACLPQGSQPLPQVGSIDVTGALGSAGSATLSPQTNTGASPVELNSQISGYLMVPYYYTYTLSQNWNFGAGSWVGACSPNSTCVCQEYNKPSTQTTTKVFTYALIDALSNELSANVEGGDTYLQYLGSSGNYYVPNLTDIGSYISPQIMLNVQNNRALGSVYVNDTLSPYTNKQAVINATDQLQYQVVDNKIGGLSYETIESLPYGPYNGVEYSLLSNPTAANANTGFSYQQKLNINSGSPVVVTLFQWYKDIVYNSPLNLFINSSSYKYGPGDEFTANLMGYQRLVYVFRDRFNNLIYAPLSVDIANITSVNLNVTPVVDINNANSTTLYINGTAGYYEPLGNFIPLKGGQIYLYYDADINYVRYNVKDGQANTANALLCAFGGSNQEYSSMVPSDCQPSDPIYTGLQDNSGTTTYSPSYNSLGVCGAPPNSLLTAPNLDCNIYGNDGNRQIPSSCSSVVMPDGSVESRYCSPIYGNGTGTCTSQLGLIGTATTNAMGFFSYNTVACGIGGVTVLAKYYGYPGPEPIQARQSFLASSADPASEEYTAFNVLNYYWLPNQTQESVQIGLAELGIGNVGAVGLAAAILLIGGIIVLTIYLNRRSKA